MSVASPEEYMIFGFFWKWLPIIFPYSVFCLARQRIHIVRQLLEASGSCRQTCSQQSDVRSFQLNMVSVPVSVRTRCRRWSVGAKRGVNGRRPKKRATKRGSADRGHHIPAPSGQLKLALSGFPVPVGRSCWPVLVPGCFWRCLWVLCMVHLAGCTEVLPHGEVPGFIDVFADGSHGSFLVCLYGVANSSELRFRPFVDGMLCNLCEPYSRRHLSCVRPCEDHCLCSLLCWGVGNKSTAYKNEFYFLPVQPVRKWRYCNILHTAWCSPSLPANMQIT